MQSHYKTGVVHMRTTVNGDARIAYQTFGDPDGEPLLLIMGLDFQMVYWPDGFCAELAARGFHVARFDNRDSGLSSHFDSLAEESPFAVLLRGGGRKPAYTMHDMAGDGLSVLDALGWESAHLCSVSMGSGIALATAILHPERVRTVTATMGGSMRRRDALRYLRFGLFLRFARIRHPDTDEGAVRTLVDMTRLLATPHAPFDEDWARAVATLSHGRAPRDPGTTQRQAAAGLSPGPLNRRVREITAPTLFINGADDPLIRPSAGAAIARQIPGARSIVQPRMGHLIQQHLWTPLADAVAAQAGLSP